MEKTQAGELARLIRDDDGAPYADAAAGRAIAIVMDLFRQERYAWQQWVEKFSAEIDAPGHYRHSPNSAEKAEAVLSGDGKSINRNYAELWLAACEKLLLEKGLVAPGELETKLAALPPDEPSTDALTVGTRVVVRDVEPPPGPDHLPLFIRGKSGIVERRFGEMNQRLQYNVRFTAQALWGDDAPQRDSLNFTIAHEYLSPETA